MPDYRGVMICSKITAPLSQTLLVSVKTCQRPDCQRLHSVRTQQPSPQRLRRFLPMLARDLRLRRDLPEYLTPVAPPCDGSTYALMT